MRKRDLDSLFVKSILDPSPQFPADLPRMMSVIRIPITLIPEVVSQEEMVLNSSSISVFDVYHREKKKGSFR